MSMAPSAASREAREAAVPRRVSNRFLWFLMLCYMINFVDRTDIGFAALIMNQDLHLSANTFGLAGEGLLERMGAPAPVPAT